MLLIEAKLGGVNLLREPKVDAVWVRLICRDLEKRGVEYHSLLQDAGIHNIDFTDAAARVPVAKSDRLFEIAAKHTGDDVFGLQLGAKADPREIGLLAYVGLSSETLSDAIHNLSHYIRVFTDRLALSIDIRGSECEIRAAAENDPGEVTAKHANEAGMAVLLKCYRLFSGRNITPLEVHFRHPRKTSLEAVRLVFECPVHFQSDAIRLVFKKSDLSIPLASADAKLLQILRGYCDDILRRRKSNTPPFLQEVSGHLAGLLPKGRANAKYVAAEMGMSQRTLIRHLQQSDTSFQSLLDGLRLELAGAYLQEKRINLSEVAFLLGYSSVSAFGHSFKRLAGKTPTEYRVSQNF